MRSEYREARERIRENLRSDAGDLILEIVQKRPYTVATIRQDDGAVLGVGFAKVNREDPWVPDYGKRLAVEKAIADAAKESIGEATLLEVDGERVPVYAVHTRYDGSVPSWMLEEDLNKQPKEWQEVPF